MHFLPLLLIPVLLWIGINARRWGLFAEVPIDPEARVGYLASQALARLKSELFGIEVVEVEPRLRYRCQAEECQLWSEQGQLWKQVGDSAPSSLLSLGAGGRVSFAKEPAGLRVSLEARESELSRSLEVCLPVKGDATP